MLEQKMFPLSLPAQKTEGCWDQGQELWTKTKYVLLINHSITPVSPGMQCTLLITSLNFFFFFVKEIGLTITSSPSLSFSLPETTYIYTLGLLELSSVASMQFFLMLLLYIFALFELLLLCLCLYFRSLGRSRSSSVHPLNSLVLQMMYLFKKVCACTRMCASCQVNFITCFPDSFSASTEHSCLRSTILCVCQFFSSGCCVFCSRPKAFSEQLPESVS